jgi:hypothetical protein
MENIRPAVKSFGYLKSSALPESTRLVYILEEQGKRRIIGQYNIKEKTFFSERIRSKHYLKKYHGWGLDSEVFLDMCDAGLKTIMIHIQDDNKTISIGVDAFKEAMQSFYIPPHRPQVVVSEIHWVSS